jgi:hypothetical protein
MFRKVSCKQVDVLYKWNILILFSDLRRNYVKNRAAAPQTGNSTSYSTTLFLLLSATSLHIVCQRGHVLLEYFCFCAYNFFCFFLFYSDITNPWNQLQHFIFLSPLCLVNSFYSQSCFLLLVALIVCKIPIPTPPNEHLRSLILSTWLLHHCVWDFGLIVWINISFIVIKYNRKLRASYNGITLNLRGELLNEHRSGS